MQRTCDGTDPYLIKDSVPCDCGETFDDVERSVIFPHVRIPTREEKDAAYATAFASWPSDAY